MPATYRILGGKAASAIVFKFFLRTIIKVGSGVTNNHFMTALRVLKIVGNAFFRHQAVYELEIRFIKLHTVLAGYIFGCELEGKVY